jgi:hypothetical protein
MSWNVGLWRGDFCYGSRREVRRLDRWSYTYADLRVNSELPIPEWTVFEEKEPFADPDVTIFVVSGLTPPACALPVLTADEYNFHIPEAGCYCVRKGREIFITPAPEANHRELRLFLLGSAWGALTYQRGILALHVSAIEIQSGAVAFCGPSGSGKSTVAAWLLNKGFRLAGDDLCCFGRSTAGLPVIYPAAPRLKLWREALNQLGKSEEGLEVDHFRQEKFHLALPEEGGRQPLPLIGVYILEWGETSLTRLTGLAALSRYVRAATYRGYLVDPIEQTATHWERCLALMKYVPVWKFRRPKNWSAMEEAMNMFLTQFRG